MTMSTIEKNKFDREMGELNEDEQVVHDDGEDWRSLQQRHDEKTMRTMQVWR
jgi:hypothetical protein